MDIDSIKELTKEHVGAVADLSYITEDLVKKFEHATELTGRGWTKEVNNLFAAGKPLIWHFQQEKPNTPGDSCGTWPWTFAGKLDVIVSIGHCANNSPKFRIGVK